MISGRTFAREMIALRQRETKRAGRILALQGQNPGQLELRTHSEFGANLSVTPGGFAFLCLRAIPRRSSPAGYHSLRLRPAGTLLDTKRRFWKSVLYTTKTMGYEPPREDMMKTFIGPPIKHSLIKAHGIDEEEANRATGNFRNRYKDYDL